MPRGYGLIKVVPGYYVDSQNLFYYNGEDHSIMLVATPGGGKRVVFKKGHNLYGPIYATIFGDDSEGLWGQNDALAALEEKDPSVKLTTGDPVPASPFAWLDSLEEKFSDRKPFVRRPAFWATAGIGALGIGYFAYVQLKKKV